MLTRLLIALGLLAPRPAPMATPGYTPGRWPTPAVDVPAPPDPDEQLRLAVSQAVDRLDLDAGAMEGLLCGARRVYRQRQNLGVALASIRSAAAAMAAGRPTWPHPVATNANRRHMPRRRGQRLARQPAPPNSHDGPEVA